MLVSTANLFKILAGVGKADTFLSIDMSMLCASKSTVIELSPVINLIGIAILSPHNIISAAINFKLNS